MNLRHLKALLKFGFWELWNSKVIHTLITVWLVTLSISFLINLETLEKNRMKAANNHAAMIQYYQNFPNPNFMFGTAYTVQRPPELLSFIAQGTSFMAPSYHDYLARYSPNSYYPDDTNVIFRLSKPFDMTIIIGIIGALLSLVLTYRAVNGELLDNNIYLLELSGVSNNSRYISKWILFQSTIIGTFLLGYTASLAISSFLYPILVSQHLVTYIFIGLISSLLIFCSVSLGLATSAITNKPQRSFSIGIAIFIVQVFVFPLLAVEVQPLLGNNPPSATDLQEKKIFYSRLIHRRLDPYTYQLKKRFQSTTINPENLEIMWLEKEKEEFFLFANANSNYAMIIDRDFFTEQEAYARNVFRLAKMISPFFSFQTAIAEFSNTGLESEKLALEETTWNHFANFRAWFWDNLMVPLNWKTIPSANKWIFAKANKKLDITEIGPLQKPTLTLIEKIKLSWIQIFSILIWGLAFTTIGWKASHATIKRGHS